jgi:hypothetical protein
MIKLIDTIKKIFTIKILLLITTIALFVISVNFTMQTIKNNKIEDLKELKKVNEAYILDSISKPKQWALDTNHLKNELKISNISLRTKYKDGMVLYSFDVSFNEKNDKRFIFSKENRFDLEFYDKDKFKIFVHRIDFSEMTIHSSNGMGVGGIWEGSFELNSDIYYSASSVVISWMVN